MKINMDPEEKPRINLRRFMLPKAGPGYLIRFALYAITLGILLYLIYQRVPQ